MEKPFKNEIKIIADVHLCKSYFEYIEPTMNNFIEEVIKDKPLFTVISGDYFDRRISADDEIYKKAIDYILEISQHTKHLIVVQGTFSHDYDSLGILNSIKKLKNNITFTKDITELSLEGYKILTIPEAYPFDPDLYYKEYLSKNYDFIFGHGDIEGAILHAGIDNRRLLGFKFSPSSLSAISRYTVFGHIHKHQFLKHNVCYPGSLGRWQFNQEEDKGYIRIDLDKDIMEFVTLEAHPFKTIIIKSEEDIKLLKEDIKNNLNSSSNNFRIKISEDLKDFKMDILNDPTLKELNHSFKFEYLKEEEVETLTDDLLYGEISKLSVEDQYLKMLEIDIDNKKLKGKEKDILIINNELLRKELAKIISSLK